MSWFKSKKKKGIPPFQAPPPPPVWTITTNTNACSGISAPSGGGAGIGVCGSTFDPSWRREWERQQTVKQRKDKILKIEENIKKLNSKEFIWK